ncbi:MAG: phosphatase PAP2 family protein [Halorhodospira sp.]
MQQTLSRLRDQELAVCLSLSRLQRLRLPRRILLIASRAGDGVLWYALMAGLLLVQGLPATTAVVRMAVTGAVASLLYMAIKRRMQRPRPCEADPRLRSAAPALDKYSFPSGHTLHAVSFSILAIAPYPGLAPWLLPVAALIAASRVVLGLHYPSDVVAGGALGCLLALISLALPFDRLVAGIAGPGLATGL